jgi:hypothetical protein
MHGHLHVLKEKERVEGQRVRGEAGPRESARERKSEGERHAREQGSGGGREVGGRGVDGERGGGHLRGH